MEVQKCSIEDVFKTYTRLSKDRQCFVIDVRPYKDWKRRHLLLSFCVRLSSNGKALVDYSKNRYDQKWTQVCCGMWMPRFAVITAHLHHRHHTFSPEICRTCGGIRT